MIRRLIRDARKSQVPIWRLLPWLALWVGSIVIIYVVGIGILAPEISQLSEKFFKEAFPGNGSAIEIIFYITIFSAVVAWAIREDRKRADDPVMARYMPTWILRLLGKSKQEIAKVKR